MAEAASSETCPIDTLRFPNRFELEGGCEEGRADCWLILKEEKRQLITPLGELPGGQLPIVCHGSWQQHRGLTVVTVPPRSKKVRAVPQCGSQGVRQSRSKTVKEEDSEDLTLFYSGFFGYFFQNHVAPRKKFN